MSHSWINCILFDVFSAPPDRYYYRTACVGQTVMFPCDTKLREDVVWKRTDRITYIYTGGRIHDAPPRITVNRNSSYTLTIVNITVGDSAVYECVEDGGHGNKRFYGLTVAGESSVSVTLLALLLNEMCWMVNSSALKVTKRAQLSSGQASVECFLCRLLCKVRL